MGIGLSLIVLAIWIVTLAGVAAYLIADLFFDRSLSDLKRFGKSKDDQGASGRADATEVGDAALIGGYLIAEESMSGFPLQIDIYTDREIYIGRSKRECDVALRDITISRRHARLSNVDGAFYLEDLGSKGGTFVGQRKLRAGYRHELHAGEVVHFYTFGYRFEFANDPTYVPDEKGTQQ